MTAMIQKINTALKAYGDANKPRIEKSLRDHLLTFDQITNEIGNAIYAARIPKHEKPLIGVKLRVLARTRHDDLIGESALVHTTVQVDVMSRLQNAEAKVSQISEMIRIATAAPCYRGYMGSAGDEIWVHGVTVERDSMEVPVPSVDKSNGWHFQYSQDLRITHDQTIAVSTSPFKIGSFVIEAFE